MKMKRIKPWRLFCPAGLMNQTPTFRDNRIGGFTLLELLIVIGIIGVLMALATVAYSSAQIGGRNARRKQDVLAIQNALEQYYSEHGFAYPGTCSDAGSYLRSSWPMDPSSTDSTPKPYVGTLNCNNSGTNAYCICASLESTILTGATSGNADSACDWNAVQKDHYCVSNLQ